MITTEYMPFFSKKMQHSTSQTILSTAFKLLAVQLMLTTAR